MASLASGGRSLAAAEARVHETRIISHTPNLYCGWPTLARRTNGQLIVVWSGGRESHVCPFGRVDMMTSDDDGDSWTWPRTLLDGAIDDRDAGVVETAEGSLLVTTFTSLAYVSYHLNQAMEKKPGDSKTGDSKTGDSDAWPAARINKWLAAHGRLDEAGRQAELGQWMLRSTDGGVTWSARYPSLVNSPHGPIQLSDGRLLYAGVRLWDPGRQVGVCESLDDGQTWQWLSDIPVRDGDNSKEYHELHAVQSDSGKIIVHIRNHNANQPGETLQCESIDGGKSWTEPHAIGVWGLPSFLLRLRSGRLLMSYGYRRPPYGNQARYSDDDGATWSEPLTISDDGAGVDLGYPSTVELDDGALLTVWYEKLQESSHAVLRQARWNLSGT